MCKFQCKNARVSVNFTFRFCNLVLCEALQTNDKGKSPLKPFVVFSPLYPHRLRIAVYFYHHYSVIHHEHSLASSSLCFLVVFFCPKIQRVKWDDCRKIHRFLLMTLKLPSKFFLSLPSSRYYCKEVSRP